MYRCKTAKQWVSLEKQQDISVCIKLVCFPTNMWMGIRLFPFPHVFVLWNMNSAQQIFVLAVFKGILKYNLLIKQHTWWTEFVSLCLYALLFYRYWPQKNCLTAFCFFTDDINWNICEYCSNVFVFSSKYVSCISLNAIKLQPVLWMVNTDISLIK